MKLFFFLLILLNTNTFTLANVRGHISLAYHEDTTLHNRFIMSLLQDYELEGRWLFVRMDSVDIFRKDWYEVIHPKTFYDCYTDHFTNITKEFFIYSLYRDITNREEFARFPPSPHSLQGVRVDVKRYKILNKLPLNILLATYFNKDKRLKKIYEKLLYEIIAACYTKNVKVITPTQGSAYYEIFK